MPDILDKIDEHLNEGFFSRKKKGTETLSDEVSDKAVKAMKKENSKRKPVTISYRKGGAKIIDDDGGEWHYDEKTNKIRLVRWKLHDD